PRRRSYSQMYSVAAVTSDSVRSGPSPVPMRWMGFPPLDRGTASSRRSLLPSGWRTLPPSESTGLTSLASFDIVFGLSHTFLLRHAILYSQNDSAFAFHKCTYSEIFGVLERKLLRKREKKHSGKVVLSDTRRPFRQRLPLSNLILDSLQLSR